MNQALLTGGQIDELLYAAPPATAAAIGYRSAAGNPAGQVGKRLGSGMDFAELRSYQPGDDPRHIDWRATARSNQPRVRRYHADISRPLCLLIDRSAGMRFGTRRRLKLTQAVRAALWLGGREARAGHEIIGILLDNPCRWLPGTQGMAGMRRLARLAAEPAPPVSGELRQHWRRLLTGLRQRLPAGCRLTIFSDLAGLDSSMTGLLRGLGAHCAVHAIRILDPLEMCASLPAEVEYRWQQRSLPVAGEVQRRAFLLRRREYAEFLAANFAAAGMALHDLAADIDELPAWL